MKLNLPIDEDCSGLETRTEEKLKDRCEFANENDFAIYRAKIFYEGFRDSKKAASILEDKLSEDENSSNLIFALAEVYSRWNGKKEKAMELCKKGLKIEPESDYGLTIKARLHYQTRELPEAYSAARSALMINLNNYEALLYHNIIGFHYASADGDVDGMKEHIENLEMAVRMFPESKRLKKVLSENREIYNKYVVMRKTGNEITEGTAL